MEIGPKRHVINKPHVIFQIYTFYMIFYLKYFRPALIFVNGVFSWDKVHVMISRSTTPDLIKMFAKLDEFFTQQLTSGKRALSAFGPLTSRNKRKMSTEHEGLFRKCQLNMKNLFLNLLCYVQQ